MIAKYISIGTGNPSRSLVRIFLSAHAIMQADGSACRWIFSFSFLFVQFSPLFPFSIQHKMCWLSSQQPGRYASQARTNSWICVRIRRPHHYFPTPKIKTASAWPATMSSAMPPGYGRGGVPVRHRHAHGGTTSHAAGTHGGGRQTDASRAEATFRNGPVDGNFPIGP